MTIRCAACSCLSSLVGSFYMAIHEMVVINKALRRMIAEGASIEEMTDAARKNQGMRSLRESAVQLVRDGVTTPEELLKITYFEE